MTDIKFPDKYPGAQRSVVGVSACGVWRDQFTQCSWVTTALCNDGSVWQMRDQDGWFQLPPIPSIEEEASQ